MARRHGSPPHHGGGRLSLPKGTSIVSEPIYVPRNTIIEGKGQDATIVRNSVSNIFHIGLPIEPPPGPGIFFTSFRDFTIQSLAPAGGHIFVPERLMVQCTWRNLFLQQANPAKSIFYHVRTDGYDRGFYDCVFENLYLQHVANATQPAFWVEAAMMQFNSNTLRDLRCEHSNTEPFMKFVCNTSQRNNGNVMCRINFEKCFGGMAHFYSAGNWLLEAMVQYDLDPAIPTKNHSIFIGRNPGFSQSYHMTLIGCDRRGGTIGNIPGSDPPDTFSDVFLQAGNVWNTVLINCGERPQSAYKVSANDTAVTWVGFGRDGQVPPNPSEVLTGTAKAVAIGDGEIKVPTGNYKNW